MYFFKFRNRDIFIGRSDFLKLTLIDNFSSLSNFLEKDEKLVGVTIRVNYSLIDLHWH